MPFVAADAEVLISPPRAARRAVAARNARLWTGVPTELLGHIQFYHARNKSVPFVAADAEVLISLLRAARLRTGVPTELLGQTYLKAENVCCRQKSNRNPAKRLGFEKEERWSE